MEALLTITDLSELLRLSRSQCYALKEKIGYLRVGGAIRFRLEDVRAYLEACTVNGRVKRPPRPRLTHLKLR